MLPVLGFVAFLVILTGLASCAALALVHLYRLRSSLRALGFARTGFRLTETYVGFWGDRPVEIEMDGHCLTINAPVRGLDPRSALMLWWKPTQRVLDEEAFGRPMRLELADPTEVAAFGPAVRTEFDARIIDRIYEGRLRGILYFTDRAALAERVDRLIGLAQAMDEALSDRPSSLLELLDDEDTEIKSRALDAFLHAYGDREGRERLIEKAMLSHDVTLMVRVGTELRHRPLLERLLEDRALDQAQRIRVDRALRSLPATSSYRDEH